MAALRHHLACGLVSGKGSFEPNLQVSDVRLRLCCLHFTERRDEAAEWMDGDQVPENAAQVNHRSTHCPSIPLGEGRAIKRRRAVFREVLLRPDNASVPHLEE